MRRVVRVVKALGAGAAVVWGLAKSLRRGGKPDAAAPGWPPPPSEPYVPPVAVAQPVPVPQPVAVAAPGSAEPVAVPTVEPAEPASSADQPLLLKGVSVPDPAALLALANTGADDRLRELGIKGKALAVLLENRPYATPEALGDTPGVGRRTIQALVGVTEG